MSPLPQRKKTAEELAQLRENLGIPPAAGPGTPPAQTPPEPAPDEPPSAAAPPKPVRSLRKSEQATAPEKPAARPATGPQNRPRIPDQRHSNREIKEIRRRETLAAMTPAPPNPKLVPARWFHIIPGYLLALAGAGCFIWREFPLAATAACEGLAIAVALAILWKRPFSRHHSAFIAMIALLVIVFGTLHFFPQLLHAT